MESAYMILAFPIAVQSENRDFRFLLFSGQLKTTRIVKEVKARPNISGILKSHTPVCVINREAKTNEFMCH